MLISVTDSIFRALLHGISSYIYLISLSDISLKGRDVITAGISPADRDEMEDVRMEEKLPDKKNSSQKGQKDGCA